MAKEADMVAREARHAVEEVVVVLLRRGRGRCGHTTTTGQGDA